MYINTIEVTEIDELCEIVGRTYIQEGGDYDMTFQHLNRGSEPSRYRCFASVAHHRVDGPLADWHFQSTLEEYGNDMEIRGTAPDTWGLLVPLGQVPIRIPSADVGPGDVYLMPPRSEMDIVSPAGLRFVDVHFDQETIREKLPWLEMDHTPSAGQRVSCAQAQVIATAVTELIAACETNGEAAAPRFDETRAHLFDAIAEIMADRETRLPEPPLRLAARRKLARQARDYLEANLDRPVAAAEILAETGGSRRGLEAAFRERYGASPIAFHRLSRLTRVRRALQQARPGEAQVSATALRYGFSHFGRFAVDYKNQFRESPSTTLARVQTRRSMAIVPEPTIASTSPRAGLPFDGGTTPIAGA